MKTFTSLILVLATISVAQTTPKKSTSATKTSVIEIQSPEELNRIVESSANRLIIFDLYADWCGPCKLLSPLLEEIAREQGNRATIYKINIDKNQGIARALNVTGIPYVLFVKNKTAVHAMTGLQPKASYVRAIEQFASGPEPSSPRDAADGELIDGTRVIRISAPATPKSLYVYRGETVTLIFDSVDASFSIHIPEYKISQSAQAGNSLWVTFKAENLGTFPMFCNGRCVTGDGMQLGSIVVTSYQGAGAVNFVELTSEQGKKLIATAKPLVLDVRTPNEFKTGYLSGAKLIPLQQLESRIGEIEEYKNQDVLIYCRSGNRSVVAAQILIRNGFTKVSHLGQGIIGWKKSGGAVVVQ